MRRRFQRKQDKLKESVAIVFRKLAVDFFGLLHGRAIFLGNAVAFFVIDQTERGGSEKFRFTPARIFAVLGDQIGDFRSVRGTELARGPEFGEFAKAFLRPCFRIPGERQEKTPSEIPWVSDRQH